MMLCIHQRGICSQQTVRLTSQAPESCLGKRLFLLNVDWTHSDDEHAAAYSRAGLPQWAAACLSGSGLPTEPASQGAPQPTSAVGPSAIVQATVSDVMLTLPHDQDFGSAERFGELWSKAFGQVQCLGTHAV